MFAATIAEIKRLKNRLQSLTFRLNFDDLYSDVNPDISAAHTACDAVLESKHFAKILELILLLGNYMNSGSKNEAAFGFEISFLTKLTSTKDHENKQTLLHYIAEVVSTKFPEHLKFIDEFSSIDKASRVSLDNIQKTMRQINVQLSDLKKDLENNKVPQSRDDRFHEVMESFEAEAREKIVILSRQQKRMESLFLKLAEYFAFDPIKYTLEELFADLKTFKDAFVQALNDNNRLKEEEEKQRRAQEAKEKHQREMQERKGKRTQALNHNVDIDGQEQTGVMDTLIAALETGSAFKTERKKRAPRPAGELFIKLKLNSIKTTKLFQALNDELNCRGVDRGRESLQRVFPAENY
jgi:diaphanous